MSEPRPEPHAEHAGLQAPPRSGPLADVEPVRRRSRVHRAMQLVGFVAGVGLLAWAVSIALGEKNRHTLEAVAHAPARTIVWLLGVSALSVLMNGLMFWVVLRPLKKLNALDTVLTNCIAVAMSALPFKINLVVRVLIHHRRDGVAFKDILAWFAAMSAMALGVLVPLGLAGWWRGSIDAMWWVVGVGGVLALSALGVGLGHLAATRPWLARLSLGADRVARDWRTVLAHMVLRMGDVMLLCARFWAAASAAGVDLPAERAVLLATTYFLLSVLAPAGALGFREMGVAGVGLASGADSSQIALVTLVVTAAEFIASGVLCVPAFFRLRPDRLLSSKGKG